MSDAGRPAIAHLEARLGDALAADQIERLAELALLLELWGARINLSGHKTLPAILDALILDAVGLSSVLPPYSRLADIGSGAGLPGLPLAILHPDRRFTLVESRVRRHHFQRAAARQLSLENVELLLGRSEHLERSPHDGAIGQALARPAVAARLLAPWVAETGWLAIPGAEEPPKLTCASLGSSVVRAYLVPGTGRRRTLLIVRPRPATAQPPR